MSKSSRLFPRHEPEVLAARANTILEKDKMGSSRSKEIIVDGTRIMSRNNNAMVTQSVAASFRCLPVRFRRAVYAMCFDLETSTCLVSLHAGHRSQAESAASYLNKTLNIEFGGPIVILIADNQGIFGIMKPILKA